jgi:hypothetical protein
MSPVKIDLDERIATLLNQTDRSIEDGVHEMIVLELYRRATITSGRLRSCSVWSVWTSSATRRVGGFHTST